MGCPTDSRSAARENAPVSAMATTRASSRPGFLQINTRRKALRMKKFFVLLAALAATSTVVVGSAFAQASSFGQREALDSAKSYLEMGGFSRAGLIDQLTSSYGEGFSHADAVWGVNHAHANWNAEAVQAAKAYLGTSHFSRAGLIQQLESPYGDHFTHAQAVYGVSRAYR